MTSSIERRVAEIVNALDQRAQCSTCYGARYAIVAVPNPDDADRPEYNPTHCRECGDPLRAVNQIIGLTEAELP